MSRSAFTCIACAVVVVLAAGCREEAASPIPAVSPRSAEIAGSVSCRACHETFYEKWATSFHGLAMQPFTAALARERLRPQVDEIVIGEHAYRADMADGKTVVRERGPDGEKAYPIAHVMGGKNVFYFLTPMERGRLQVLPVAYDVRKEEWYDTTASMVRHVTGLDEAIHWTHRALTFNTSCYSCHVSQLSKNYSLATDTYQTTWAEPGINCETCHGSATEHVRVCVEAGERVPDDVHIISTVPFNADQINSLCAPCHAKMTPLTASFTPGHSYFDHYNLTTLEDRDFYPDGRDLGENFTFTLWRISPCAASGKLDCAHCHTSSGRYRFAGEATDQACMPCHAQHVGDPAAHSHHLADSKGSRCVACHMPKTWFARMQRHDHTMLAPTPAATIAFDSPNACNLCHADQDAAWSDAWVRQWYPRDYQAPVLHRASLIDAARKGDWSRLPDMLAYLTADDRNEIYTTSLIRLLETCPNAEKWPAIRATMGDSSPLVRASAANALADWPDAAARDALLAATGDAFRVVRVNAAFAISRHRLPQLDAQTRSRLLDAVAEYEAFLNAVPDDPMSHYNRGIFLQNLERPEQAADAYETAIRLDPDHLLARVNVSLVYAGLSHTAADAGKAEQEVREYAARAERVLREALRIDPVNAAANFNFGLLLSELGRLPEAEACLRQALKTDPNFPEAAYNLGVLLAGDRLDEAIVFCGKAAELRPGDPKYAYTLAFFLHRKGELEAARTLLEGLIDRHPEFGDAYRLLDAVEQEIIRRDVKD